MRMCVTVFDASTYLLRIYVLFELFMLAQLRITALHCAYSSFEKSHQLKHK
jgi:hypothetical protein